MSPRLERVALCGRCPVGPRGTASPAHELQAVQRFPLCMLCVLSCFFSEQFWGRAGGKDIGPGQLAVKFSIDTYQHAGGQGWSLAWPPVRPAVAVVGAPLGRVGLWPGCLQGSYNFCLGSDTWGYLTPWLPVQPGCGCCGNTCVQVRTLELLACCQVLP